MKATWITSLALVALTCAFQGTSEGQVRACERQGSSAMKTPVVDDYKITVLSDMIPGRNTMAEWGYSALVEVTSQGVSKRFLFDSGDKPATVVSNAATLGINLCDIEDIVLSHNHQDHTGGLDNLRSTCKAQNPKAFSRAHVGGQEIFWPRIDNDGKQKNPMVKEKTSYEAQEGTFVVNDKPHEFMVPGVFLTGRIPRTYDEKTYVPTTPMKIQDPSGKLAEEIIPEDQALVINTADGVVVLTGCGHAGTVNTIEQAVRVVGGGRPKVILMGGVHWLMMSQGNRKAEGTLDWEAQHLAELNVVAMLGGHCTGIERFTYVREYLGLDPAHAVVSAVGTILSKGLTFTFTMPLAVNTPIPVGTDQRDDGHEHGHDHRHDPRHEHGHDHHHQD